MLLGFTACMEYHYFFKKEKGRKMKKNFKICMFGLMAVMMASGCSAKTDSTATTETGVTTEATTQELETTTEGPRPEELNPGEIVSLAEYKGVTYTPLSTEVTDEEIETRIQQLLDAYPSLQKVDRAAQNGDIVNIDYVGTKDGVAFDGGTDNGYDLPLGSGQFIDGFEAGLIGATAGQKVTLNLTFPESYPNEELAGQPVVFEVTVNEVQESVKAELNDAFIAENTDSSTVDEYRAALRKEMEETAISNAENQKRTDVFNKVVDNSEVTISDEAVQAYYEDQYKSYEEQAALFGLDLETMMSYYGMDLATFEDELMVMSKEGCKQNIVVNAIAKEENIVVEEQELKDMADAFGYENVDAMAAETGLDNIKNYILTEKIVALIAENAVIE